MIVLSTDFGLEGPYLGQVKAVLYQQVPNCHLIDLFSDLPSFNPFAAAVLLAAYSQNFPDDSIFLSIVDPGVGMPERKGVVVRTAKHWFVGPSNGLFDRVIAMGSDVRCWEITWQPERLSDSFHGRDLFAPIAAQLAEGRFPTEKLSLITADRHDLVELSSPSIVYIDHFGNLITSLLAGDIVMTATFILSDHEINYARTFGEVEIGALFWYKNSNGLVEIASNSSSAAKMLNASIGDALTLR
jgi:S-adenosylmethionine hydrolase